MTEEDFLKRWNDERPLYEKWGEYVARSLVEKLQPLIAPISTDLFIKLPIMPRLKSGGSFITKAFYNTKRVVPYQNPFDEITDKVGVRIVVLLASQISKVEAAIEHCDAWDFSKDKDYELEIAENPTVFNYQSVHYIVRTKAPMQIDDFSVPRGTPCEVQIRTLLQHAHSELTHDTIYKPSVEQTPEMIRAASKAMALIEATTDYFEDVARVIERLITPTRKLTEELGFLYYEKVGFSCEHTKADNLLMEAYGSDDASLVSHVRRLLDEKPFVAERIADRSRTKILFRQPSILLVYKAVVEGQRQARQAWPLTPKELAPVYADLGIAFD